ncbi:putative non-structural protein 23 [Etheostoma fonticola aquareovirus]|uniref:putative non-structural protein 23 n=1 Tax=Etheostoma fonticola aquareovirus TaxID=1862978 RepID=UPI0007F178AD|nr:putative non-structural protein 23 [Etheostoma fonticola aquareovirus]ANN11952.1 putative non-structural protein 23 [Etheostoma fonticola aquareovirus]
MGNTISNTVQYTVLQIDRSCCIKTSLTATSEATSWAIPPIAICCCCCLCCAGGLYLVHSGRLPSISRRLDVLRDSRSTPEHKVRRDRFTKPRIHRPRLSSTSDSSDLTDLELSWDGFDPLAYPHWSAVNSPRARPAPSVHSQGLIPLVTLQPRAGLDNGVVHSQPSRSPRPHQRFEDWLQQAHLLRPGDVPRDTNPFRRPYPRRDTEH